MTDPRLLADLAAKSRRRRTAWEALRARMRRRPSLLLGKDDAETALAMWREERRLGRRDDPDREQAERSPLYGLGSVLPGGADGRLRMEGDPIRQQVARFVEGEEGSVYRRAFEDWRRLGLDDAWMLRVIEERLPMRFLGPWEGICEADVDEIEAQDREDEAAAAKDAEEERASSGDGRLMVGMMREG